MATHVQQVGAHQPIEQQDPALRHPQAMAGYSHHYPSLHAAEQHQARLAHELPYAHQQQANLVMADFGYPNHHHHHYHQVFDYGHQQTGAELAYQQQQQQQPTGEFVGQQHEQQVLMNPDQQHHQIYSAAAANNQYSHQQQNSSYANNYANVHEQQSAAAYHRHMLNAGLAAAANQPAIADQGRLLEPDDCSSVNVKFLTSLGHNNSSNNSDLDADDAEELEDHQASDDDYYSRAPLGDRAHARSARKSLAGRRRQNGQPSNASARCKRRPDLNRPLNNPIKREDSVQGCANEWSGITERCAKSGDARNGSACALELEPASRKDPSSSTRLSAQGELVASVAGRVQSAPYSADEQSPALRDDNNLAPEAAYSSLEAQQAINNIGYTPEVSFHRLDTKLADEGADSLEGKQTSSSSGHAGNSEYSQLRILEMRKEKSRDAARSRRSKENHEFYELAKLLPLPAAITSQLDFLDKASIIRLTISFLKLRQFSVNGHPPWAPDFTTLGSINPYSSQSLSSFAEHYSSNSSVHDDQNLSRPTSVVAKQPIVKLGFNSQPNLHEMSVGSNGSHMTPTVATLPSSVAFTNSIDPTPSSGSTVYRQSSATICHGQDRLLADKKSTSLFDLHQGTHILQSLDGFAFAIGRDGRFLYISETVSMYLGLSQVEMTGSSVFDYTHQQDHEELAKQLGIPYSLVNVSGNECPQSSSAINAPGADSPQPASVHSQYSAASNETLLEEHVNSSCHRKRAKVQANGTTRGAYGRGSTRRSLTTSSCLTAGRQVTLKIESDATDVNSDNGKTESTFNRRSEATGTSEDPLVRQFCIRMKSTLTKRGCQHFKSSGYRVVHVVAHLRSYQSNDHGHLMDPLDKQAITTNATSSDNFQKQSVKRRSIKASTSTGLVKSDNSSSPANLQISDRNQDLASDKCSSVEKGANSSDTLETSHLLLTRAQQKPKIIGMVAVAIALPPPSINELKLESDTFVLRLSLDLRITHVEPRITELLHFPVEAIAGKSLYSLVHPADVEQVQKCHKDLLKKGQMMSGYYRVLCRTGGYIWVQTCATLICNSNVLSTQPPAALSASPMPSVNQPGNQQPYLSQNDSLQCKVSSYLAPQMLNTADNYQSSNLTKVASPGISSHLSSNFDQQDQDQCIIFVNYMITNTVDSSEILDVCQCADYQPLNSSFSGSTTLSSLSTVHTIDSQMANGTSAQFNSPSSSCSSPCLSSLKNGTNNHTISTSCRSYVPASTPNSVGVNLTSFRRLNPQQAESKNKDKIATYSRRTLGSNIKTKTQFYASSGAEDNNNQSNLTLTSCHNNNNLSHLAWSNELVKPVDGAQYEHSGAPENSTHPIYTYGSASGVGMALNCVSGSSSVNKGQVSDQSGWLNHHQSAAVVAARLGDPIGAYSGAQQATSDPYVSMNRSTLYKAAFGLEVGNTTTNFNPHPQHSQQASNFPTGATYTGSTGTTTSASPWDTTAAVAAVAAASNLTSHPANPYAHLDTHHTTGLSSATTSHHNPGSYYNYYGYYSNKFI